LLGVVASDAEMHVDPTALSLHLVDLALAVLLTTSLEREHLRVPGSRCRVASTSRTVIPSA
jgi:hypothetical protein